MKELCFATNNKHKIEEVRSIIEPDFRILSLRDIGCHDELPETGLTLEANSLEKAQYVFSKFSIPCFADDSGLEVDTLNGAPGVFSARYAGDHKNDGDNTALLLSNLAGKENRAAQFRTVISLLEEKGKYIFGGTIKGSIIHEKRGNNGFGYDPVFVPEGYSLTFAEMPSEQKNAISHRAIAVKKLCAFLIRNYISKIH